eukprot:5382998-Amphidinium_carterae.2
MMSIGPDTAKTVINYNEEVQIDKYFAGFDMKTILQHLKDNNNDGDTSASEGQRPRQSAS